MARALARRAARRAVLNAVQVEIANPAGDGVRILPTLGLTLDLALRLVGSAMRLRRLIP